MGTLRGRVYWLSLLVALVACSNGSGSLEDQQQQPPPSQPAQVPVTIGGSVSGLAGNGLVLQNNGAGNLSIASDGSFQFADTILSGATYSVTVLTQPTTPTQTCTVANGSGAAPETNVTNIVVTCTSAPRYTIGGTVSGLTGSGLVLQNSGGDNFAVTTNGPFTFSRALAGGTAYNVTVSTQPNGQNCVVRNPSGTVASANVTNVEVACVTNQYTVGGTVTGLAGTGFVLQLNGANDLAVVNNGTFAFSIGLAPGATYTVTVKAGAQPRTPTQDCTLTNAVGTVANANVTNIAVTCATSSFTVGGSVAGLAGSGLVLQLNGGNDLAVPSNGMFAFATPLVSGGSYTVTVKTQPTNPTQVCTPANASGTIGGANVVNVAITCATQTYRIGGTVLGLQGAGLVLRNNGGDDLAIGRNGRFRFATALASGAAYSVAILTQPSGPTQACSITNGTGNVASAEVSDIVVNCSTSNFTVGGTADGLLGTGLVLTNNGTDNVTVNAAGPFTFPTTIPSGAAYNVTIAQQPTNPIQTCSVTSGAGTVGGENVTSVLVGCVTSGFTIGGNVTGLTGIGLLLQNNGADDLPVAASGVFNFATPLLPGTPYNVTVAAQPIGQVCFVTGGSGLTPNGNVQNVQVSCF